MGRYSDWTKEEVWSKTDWEGGICGVLGWGGPDIFEAFGSDAIEAARKIEENMCVIYELFDQFEKERGETN